MWSRRIHLPIFYPNFYYEVILFPVHFYIICSSVFAGPNSPLYFGSWRVLDVKFKKWCFWQWLSLYFWFSQSNLLTFSSTKNISISSLQVQLSPYQPFKGLLSFSWRIIWFLFLYLHDVIVVLKTSSFNTAALFALFSNLLHHAWDHSH